jgi:hypothetical protein
MGAFFNSMGVNGSITARFRFAEERGKSLTKVLADLHLDMDNVNH